MPDVGLHLISLVVIVFIVTYLSLRLHNFRRRVLIDDSSNL